MKKILITLLVLASIANAFDIVVPFTSYHYNADPDVNKADYTYTESDTHKLNNKNLGLIVKFNNNFKIGYYKNSYYKDTFLIGYDKDLIECNEVVFGASLNIGSGYDASIILPSLYVEIADKLRVDITVAPIYNLDKEKYYPVVAFGFCLMFEGIS